MTDAPEPPPVTRYYAAFDPAQYNFVGVVAAYSCPESTVTAFQQQLREQERVERKRKRLETKARAAAAAAAETAEPSEPLVVAKKRKTSAKGDSVPTKIIDLAAASVPEEIEEEAPVPKAQQADGNRYTLLPGETLKIVSMRFFDLHRNDVLLKFDDTIDGTKHLQATSRHGGQSVGEEQRRANLGDLPSRLGWMLADWEALCDVTRWATLVIEAQNDAAPGKTKGRARGAARGGEGTGDGSHSDPINYALAKSACSSISTQERTLRLGLPRRIARPVIGKAGVPIGKTESHAHRKALSVAHAKAAVASFKDVAGNRIFDALQRAKIKLDDFADCYNMILKAAREDAGIHIIER